MRGGETRATARPFAPIGRQPLGFWVVEAASAEEVARLAARIPTTAGGGFEVRPVMAIPDGSPVWEKPGLLSEEADRFQ